MLSVESKVRRRGLPVTAMRRALRPLLKKAGGRDLELVIVGSRAMRRLNREHHHCDATTDVLAFPGDGRVLLGSVVVCTDVALRESKARGLSLASEMALYAVHGTLHLMGHRDDSPAGSRRMRQAEVRALRAAGLSTDRLERP
ncbi:MAG: rRNA maturation RNase YbeY [Planctomycetota bacterium]